MQIKSKIWIEVKGKPVFGIARKILLKAIDDYASINRAAKEINISYRKAWNHIRTIDKRLGIRCVAWRVGG